MEAMRLNLRVLLLLFAFGCLQACNAERVESETKPKTSYLLPTEHAVEYEILFEKDTSFQGRVRKSIHIYAPEAKEYRVRAETTLKAAIDAQKKWSADAVGVFLEVKPSLMGQGHVLAIANYSPDGGGWSGDTAFKNITWESEASDIVLSDNDIRIGEMWYERRNRFQVDDGFGGKMTDDDAVKEDIAKELGIDPSEVSLLPLAEVISSRKNYSRPN